MYKAYSQICEHHKDNKNGLESVQIWKNINHLDSDSGSANIVYINNMILVRNS